MRWVEYDTAYENMFKEMTTTENRDVGSEATYKYRLSSGISSAFAERLTAEVVTPWNRATSAPE